MLRGALPSAEYDRWAPVYARYRRCHPSVLQELVRGGGLDGSSRVLEMGSGTGNYIAALNSLVGCACAAVEPSAGMRAVARRNAPGVSMNDGRAEALPFAAASFDFAFCVNVVHHVADRTALFREAFRVLVDDGTLCIATESHDMIRQRFVMSEYFPETVEADIARYSRIEDLRRMAEAAGFDEWYESVANAEMCVESADVYEAKAFSSLRMIPDAAFERGLERLKSDLGRGPLRAVVPVLTLLWASK
jgi:ubiquinone/menaquinone biosynthesis C-methylase UbiE